MRRKDRKVKDTDKIMEIIKKCEVCELALFDNDYPYIIPLNFGYEYNADDNDEKLYLYFHRTKVGKKIDLIKNNNKAAFEMHCSTKLIIKEIPCDCTTEFESVIGNGKIEIVEDNNKINGLKQIMKQYSNINYKNSDFNEKTLNSTVVLKLKVNQLSGKAFKK